MRTTFIMVLASSIVAGFAFRELSAGIAFADTDSPSVDYLSENTQNTESASEVMIFLGEQAPGLSLDAEISLGPGASDVNSPNRSLLAQTTPGPVAADGNPGPALGTERSTGSRTVLTIVLCLLVFLCALGALMIWTCCTQHR